MNHTKTTTILKKIKKIRVSKGYSQEYMAYQLGIGQSTYHKLESGKQQLKTEHFLSILEMLDIDIMTIL